ncbi:rod shape-determining protein MreC [Paludibacter sp.]|jgi:rod shape-determining protein MreC|uniref:rod shape-determining protein MreC n=1 Tax=Paludibacter sp. TaxID=1898105 RepID=UPI0013543B2C|nr:rod shape-determining protein MreC [Paludibacter sp.]MTK53461.1 rod shape-determining protein MreC [Paludibacter sp.]
MEQLLRFLMRYGVYFLFVFLEAISFVFIVNQNSFQRASFLSSSNYISASVYSAANSFVEYFGLSEANKQLSDENNQLKNKVVRLEAELAQLTDTTDRRPLVLADKEYQFIAAKVISNSVNKLKNSITLNKGRLDGIEPEMGVINNQGVVGVVSAVTDHYASVIPVLNSKSRISCKSKRSNDFGVLLWNGIDPDYVQVDEVPRHAVIHVRDTLVTSGFSSIFPEGIPVGYVTRCATPENKSYYSIEAKTAAIFRTLSYVKVVKFKYKEELREVQKEEEQ